jgi:hypothetical protein
MDDALAAERSWRCASAGRNERQQRERRRPAAGKGIARHLGAAQVR